MDIIKSVKKKNDINILSPGILIFISLLLIKYTYIGSILSVIISFIFNPFIDISLYSAKSIKDTFNGFSNYQRIIDEYYQLKERVYTYESDYSLIEKIKDENEQLKHQLGILPKDEVIVKVAVLEILENESRVVVNSGDVDSIKNGMAVIISNIFIGYVDKVDENRSSIIMLNNRGVTLRGAIIRKSINEKSDLNDIKKAYMNNRVADVVVVGDGRDVWVENIPNGKAKNGDIVVLSDNRYSNNYVLGYITEIDNDLAKTTQRARLIQYFDYTNLNYYYVVK